MKRRETLDKIGVAVAMEVMSTMVDTIVQNQVETIEVVKPTVALRQNGLSMVSACSQHGPSSKERE